MRDNYKYINPDYAYQAQYITDIKQIISSARAKAYTAANFATLEAYWLIGKKIVKEEQHDKNHADYGKEILNVSLTGRGRCGGVPRREGSGKRQRRLERGGDFPLLFFELALFY